MCFRKHPFAIFAQGKAKYGNKNHYNIFRNPETQSKQINLTITKSFMTEVFSVYATSHS